MHSKFQSRPSDQPRYRAHHCTIPYQHDHARQVVSIHCVHGKVDQASKKIGNEEYGEAVRVDHIEQNRGRGDRDEQELNEEIR